MNKVLAAAAALLPLLVATPAQALGLQYGMELYSISADADNNQFFSPAEQIKWGPAIPAFGAVMPLHSFTLWDESGILLAAIGTAAAADTSRRQAEESARNRGKKAGDTYSYSYAQRDVVSGNMYFRYAFGQANAANVSFDGGATTNTYDTTIDVKLVEFGLYKGHELLGFPTMMKFEGLGRFINFSDTYVRSDGAATTLPSYPAGRSKDTSGVALPLSYGPVFSPFPGFTVLPMLGFDLFSPISALIQGNNLGYTYGVEADYRAFQYLHASVFARGISSSLLDGQNYNAFSLGAHAGLRF